MEDSLITTRIKDRPVNRKKLIRRYMLSAFSAVIFGVVACVTFIALEPGVSGVLHPEEQPSIVEFPEETVDSELNPEDMLLPETPPGNVTVEEVQEIVSQEIDSKASEAASMGPEELQSLSMALVNVAREAQGSLVSVLAVMEETDWFDNSFEASGAFLGVVIADNGLERLVLVRGEGLEDAEDLRVVLSGGERVRARVKARDERTGLYVVAISHSAMPYSALEANQPMVLGSSVPRQVEGMPVIALMPQGGISIGNVMLASRNLSLPDINLRMLNTNLYAPENVQGFLINLKGQLIGVIDQEHAAQDNQGLLCALGMTDLRSLVENLSNGGEFPNLGIIGQDITEEVQKAQEIPPGVYIVDVEYSSPAMRSGLRPGDIIQSFDGEDILSFRALTDKLLRAKTGIEHEFVILRDSQGEYREETYEIELE
ncbi:MAG: serine protease [Lachnospiraceae bacterium]|nr:serine protease [Lachnospiraceae bacterium]